MIFFNGRSTILVPCLCVFGIFHFGLYYLYSSITYLKAKEKYDTQREKLAGRYKAKTTMYEALMFLVIWYTVSTIIFQMIQKKEFLTDCRIFFDTIATFTQTIADWIIQTGKEAAKICNGLSNPIIEGMGGLDDKNTDLWRLSGSCRNTGCVDWNKRYQTV